MTMHVCGIEPATADGAHFEANLAGWSPLAEFACQMAPEVTASVEDWHLNEGDGLDADDAAALAVELEIAVLNGRAQSWAMAYAAVYEIADIPYFIADVDRFAKFLRECGGFEIN